MEEASVFFVCGDARCEGWGTCRGVIKARLCDWWVCTSRQREEDAASRWRFFKGKYVFFSPGEGFKEVGGFKVCIRF
jgi:hypothetical protein